MNDNHQSDVVWDAIVNKAAKGYAYLLLAVLQFWILGLFINLGQFLPALHPLSWLAIALCALGGPAVAAVADVFTNLPEVSR